VPCAEADLFHLRELIDRLRAHIKRVKSVPALHDAARRRMKLLEAELRQCKTAYLEPAEPHERVTQLAARANEQFRIYRVMFAGRQRLSRRPGLSERLFGNLVGVLDEMKAVDESKLSSAASNQSNIELVTKQLEQIRHEGMQIASSRHYGTREELVRQLGADANAEAREYKKNVHGKEPAAVDLEILGGICDRLGDVVAQMAVVAEQGEDSVNLANLRLATKNLVAYEDLYLRLADARPEAAATEAVAAESP
jgi:hypothetical protein